MKPGIYRGEGGKTASSCWKFRKQSRILIGKRASMTEFFQSVPGQIALLKCTRMIPVLFLSIFDKLKIWFYVLCTLLLKYKNYCVHLIIIFILFYWNLYILIIIFSLYFFHNICMCSNSNYHFQQIIAHFEPSIWHKVEITFFTRNCRF